MIDRPTILATLERGFIRGWGKCSAAQADAMGDTGLRREARAQAEWALSVIESAYTAPAVDPTGNTGDGLFEASPVQPGGKG